MELCVENMWIDLSRRLKFKWLEYSANTFAEFFEYFEQSWHFEYLFSWISDMAIQDD